MEFEDSDWDKLHERAYERAYIEASELVGPNSPEFAALMEKLTEKYIGEL